MQWTVIRGFAFTHAIGQEPHKDTTHHTSCSNIPSELEEKSQLQNGRSSRIFGYSLPSEGEKEMRKAREREKEKVKNHVVVRKYKSKREKKEKEKKVKKKKN